MAQAGEYSVLARYEAGYRFDSSFSLSIKTSDHREVFRRVYGNRHNLKVWAFGAGRGYEGGAAGSLCGNKGHPGSGLQAECMWPYGATENIVWEGINATASLLPGQHYIMTIAGVNNISAVAQWEGAGAPEEQLFCQRNIDVRRL